MMMMLMLMLAMQWWGGEIGMREVVMVLALIAMVG